MTTDLSFYSATHDLNKSPDILTTLFADDQAIISASEDSLQKAVYDLNKVAMDCGLEISVSKNKLMIFDGSEVKNSHSG